jgi:hypothetical protein
MDVESYPYAQDFNFILNSVEKSAEDPTKLKHVVKLIQASSA